jgi:hypothetical protein
MSTQTPVQVTFGGISTEYSNKGFTHETLTVTKTATMFNGSALVAAGTEAAIANVALVTQVIDDPAIDIVATGDTALVAVAVRGCIFNTAAINYSDAGAFVPASATLLNAALNIYK